MAQGDQICFFLDVLDWDLEVLKSLERCNAIVELTERMELDLSHVTEREREFKKTFRCGVIPLKLLCKERRKVVDVKNQRSGFALAEVGVAQISLREKSAKTNEWAPRFGSIVSTCRRD